MAKKETSGRGNPANMRSKPNPPMRPGVGKDMAKAMVKGPKKKK